MNNMNEARHFYIQARNDDDMNEIKEYREIKESIIQKFDEHVNIINRGKELLDKITNAILLIQKTFENGGNIFLIGNGGSAADCSHIAAEFISIGYPAIALTTDTSVLTSIGNDFGFNQIFGIQLNVLGRQKDLLIAISTSGNSLNILEGIDIANKKGMKIIGLTGRSGGNMKNILSKNDILINVPSENVQRIQELHIMIGHTIFEIIRDDQ